MSEENDDLWIEAQIQKELNSIVDENENIEVDESLEQDVSESSIQDEFLLPSMQDYFLKVKGQTDRLEEELKECDLLLNESELVSARKSDGASTLLLELAVEQGVDPESLKKQILEELEKEDEEADALLLRDDLDIHEYEPVSEKHENRVGLFTTEIDINLDSPLETERRGELSDHKSVTEADVSNETSRQNDNATDSKGQENLAQTELDWSDNDPNSEVTSSSDKIGSAPNNIVLGPGEGVVAEISQFDVLERQALQKLQGVIKQRKQKENVWKEEQNKRKALTEEKDKSSEEMRKLKIVELEEEHKTLTKKKVEKDIKFNAEIKQAQEKCEEELKVYEAEINELAKLAEQEKEEFRKALEEEKNRQEKLKIKAAIKIQSFYRGHRVRVEFGEMVRDRIEESKFIKEQERIKTIEKERLHQKQVEQQRQEEDITNKQKVEEERKRKDENEKKAKLLEEQMREEEKKKKIEEERKRKEEEARKKEDENRRKAEQENWKRQEEERIKEEARKRLEEQQRKKEEEARLKKEAEQNRIKEERLKLEEEQRKKDEEERRRIEELKRKAEEERKIKEEAERKRKEEEERKQEEERKKRERHLKQIGKLDPVNGHAADSSVFEEWGECLPLTIEQKRMAWMKECKPWSKTLSELKSKKPASSKRPLRRPISAKKLPLLEDQTILASAGVASLQQVTTVELHDLPGCSLKTLSQCVSLKSLTMNNCNIVALEGLEECKTLHYVDIKYNKCEMINMKDMVTLVYLDVSHNSLTSVHGIDGCISLKYLNLEHNRITRLGGMESLKKLHTLKLDSNQLITTRGMSESPTVQDLSLSNNHLPNVDEIDKLGLLQSLDVSGNNLLQIPRLTNNVLLQRLVLSSNSISTLHGLVSSWLPLLTHIDISQNSIASLVDLTPSCINLQDLKLNQNQILELNPMVTLLAKFRHLRSLSIEGNPVSEEQTLLDIVSSKLPRLLELDGKPTRCKPEGFNLTTFEKLCKSQCLEHSQLTGSYQRNLKSARKKDHAQVHHKHFTKSNQLAAEHRYAHEYGDMSTKPAAAASPESPAISTPSASPANSFDQAIKSAAHKTSLAAQKAPRPAKAAPTPATQMKNKFEEALMNASKPNTTVMSAPGPAELSADSVGTVLRKESLIDRERTVNKAATQIQARWRGYSIRKEIAIYTERSLAAMDAPPPIENKNRYQMGPPDGAPPVSRIPELRMHIAPSPITNKAATTIQALWRGYILRKKLMMAMNYARFEEVDDDLPDMDIDMGAFDFNEADLDKDWTPPETPQLPNSTPVVGRAGVRNLVDAKQADVPLFEKPPHPPEQPRHVWRGQSPLYGNGKPPLPPLPPSSRLSEHSEGQTHRTMHTRREEKITEEWGFSDSRTAELMLARAKKLKYNAEKRKKLGKLDPKQRLALFRKLEETTNLRPVQPPARKQAPRKEYFKAREEEVIHREREKKMESHEKVSRTFEWVHTHVGDHELESSRNAENSISKGGFYGSDNNLPRLENNGRRTNLTASPSLDLQSIESTSIAGDMPKPRRLSMTEGDRLPPITCKTSSAPTVRPGEKMSWRGPEVQRSGGWGGGKKRSSVK